jgi:hypothetical protein
LNLCKYFDKGETLYQFEKEIERQVVAVIGPREVAVHLLVEAGCLNVRSLSVADLRPNLFLLRVGLRGALVVNAGFPLSLFEPLPKVVHSIQSYDCDKTVAHILRCAGTKRTKIQAIVIIVHV